VSQDPNAPEGYVSQEALQRGGEGLAGSAAVGSIAARAPAGALRSGMARGAGDLDPSHSARMARALEQGYDIENRMYHGTNANNLTEFRDDMIGSANDQGYYGRGHYFAAGPGEAGYYGPNVGEYVTRAKLLDLSNDTGDLSYSGHFKSFAPKLQQIGALDDTQTEALRSLLAAEKYIDDNAQFIIHTNPDGSDGWSIKVPNPADGYTDEIRMRGNRGEYPATKEEALEDMKYQFVNEMMTHHKEVFPGLDKQTASLSDYIRADSNIGSSGLTEAAKRSGYGGIRYGDETVVFDPKDIRSVNAMFDPAKSDSANLLAANRSQAAAPGQILAQKNASDINVISPRSRELIQDIVYDRMEDADPFYIRPAGERPANAPFAKRKQREYESRAGNQVSRTPDEMTVSRDDIGYVEGTMDRDPQITYSEIIPSSRGTGVGSSMYRDWAKEAGVPFRSDAEVSAEAAAIYDKMFPKYGYNVMRNPRAEYDPQGGLSGTGGWYGPGGQHVYRVEPPGMKSDEFYTNPLAGALTTMYDAPPQQGPTIGEVQGRRIPPEEEAQRQALIRYLQGGQ
jgi:hypothetical protein